jgi:nicotinamide-nucleotide amidase
MQHGEIIEVLTGCLRRRGWMLACAESCTGGGIAAALTDVAGSSAWFDRGFVTYSNQSKQDMLGVASETLMAHGAVSRETVLEMVGGALANSSAQVAVAVTGIAGPGGGTAAKPVGTVWLGWASAEQTVAVCERFEGDRAAVRSAVVDRALRGLVEICC